MHPLYFPEGPRASSTWALDRAFLRISHFPNLSTGLRGRSGGAGAALGQQARKRWPLWPPRLLPSVSAAGVPYIMGNACGGPPSPAARTGNQWGAYSADEASLYEAAIDNDVARATALLAIPGVRPDGYRHARVRARLCLCRLSVCLSAIFSQQPGSLAAHTS